MLTDRSRSYSQILRAAAYQQTDNGLLYVPPTYKHRLTNAAWTIHRQGIAIKRFELHNRSGGAASVGIGFRIANPHWIMGRLSAGGATYTALTSSAQSSSTTTTLQVAGANQTGFVIGCTIPFDWVSVYITTAETNAGGSTVVDHAVQYSDVAGTGWTDLGANGPYTDDFTLTNTVYTAAVKNFVWAPPENWGAWTSTVLPTGYYYLRFTSAEREASDVAAVATGMEIGRMWAMEALADNGTWEVEACDFKEYKADGVVAYFSTANAGNRVFFEAEAIG